MAKTTAAEKFSVPDEVIEASKTLAEAGFETYLVGGCVRDMLLGREPKDWDVATNARPEEVQKCFPDHVYENDFGTVGVKTGSEDLKLAIVEITTYRIEGKYTDKRHPDEVRFAATIEEDLSRRDFTVNALAMNLKGGIIDPFGGKKDLQAKIVRTVGAAEERFNEDALRLMRAVRFAVELGFVIDPATRRAIEKLSGELEMIAKERIRDEFVKIMLAPEAAKGIIMLEELGLLRHVLPELSDSVGVGQNKHHIYNVFEHSVRALDYAAKENYSLAVRMASLLHDVGKPRSKQGEGPDSSFYQHEYIGAKMTLRALDRLRFPKDFTEQVAHLVRTHMFYYNVGEISDAGVRRFVRRVGSENIDDLLKVREADRIGSGVAKAVPYKLRHLLFMIDKVKRDPLSPKMLKLNGDELMKLLKLEPGPRVGWILSALLEEVLDDPARNTREYLEKRAKVLGKMDDKKLKKLAESAREAKDEFAEKAENKIKKKYFVQ
jgi:tRNA nucleotidyltransferase (CCA-adding enzyme)